VLLSRDEKKNRRVPDSGSGKDRIRCPEEVFIIIIFLRKCGVKGRQKQRYLSFPGHAGRKNTVPGQRSVISFGHV